MSQEKKRKLYELSGKEDERRTSPPCWTIRFALAHKGLDYEDIAWRRVEKDTIAFSGQGLVSLARSQSYRNAGTHFALCVKSAQGVHASTSIGLDKTPPSAGPSSGRWRNSGA